MFKKILRGALNATRRRHKTAELIKMVLAVKLVQGPLGKIEKYSRYTACETEEWQIPWLNGGSLGGGWGGGGRCG